METHIETADQDTKAIVAAVATVALERFDSLFEHRTCGRILQLKAHKE
jgi:hypothetical protein